LILLVGSKGLEPLTPSV